MVAIVEAYLDDLPWDAVGLAVEVGCGTGPTARRMAARSAHTRVLGIEPSPELLTHARRLAEGIDNLTFETGDGAALPLDDGTVDAIVFHTVLCRVVAPAELLTEALRVLRPGGTLVVCDADFSKASLAGFDFDPLQACADFFVANYVTDRYLVAKLRTLVKGVGFHLKHFRITSRAVTDADGMLVWVRLGGAMMLGHGEIGQQLADALVAEYQRRKEAGTLYGHQPFATLIATWGAMLEPEDTMTHFEFDRFDHLAGLMLDPDGHFKELRHIYEQDGMRMPGEVFNANRQLRERAFA